jgi:hypothetical protein
VAVLPCDDQAAEMPAGDAMPGAREGSCRAPNAKRQKCTLELNRKILNSAERTH